MASRREAHWRGEGGGVGVVEGGVIFLWYAPAFVARADKESSVFTWKGRVDRQARQARDLVLAPRAVVPPVAGLL